MFFKYWVFELQKLILILCPVEYLYFFEVRKAEGKKGSKGKYFLSDRQSFEPIKSDF
ncbi:MAG: hypothetical protein F6K25_29735 [Okeania sp. SIO2G4]|uniref:hypothetical protein n=1 Tax=unclassified Okeania TaxID=2634635 RepID=UPI0013B7A86E|nr:MULTISPECIES: hypothetical protein [unclassified Okeania]NEP75781.1 hypothetical protein [Okeania sp. SIO2G5]NEP96956.1 hypothetical protein [Okeania sp. SIO2F5]NEQ94598.1 hypothetical protein [Okeania sp. SIO2G4]